MGLRLGLGLVLARACLSDCARSPEGPVNRLYWPLGASCVVRTWLR